MTDIHHDARSPYHCGSTRALYDSGWGMGCVDMGSLHGGLHS